MNEPIVCDTRLSSYTYGGHKMTLAQKIERFMLNRQKPVTNAGIARAVKATPHGVRRVMNEELDYDWEYQNQNGHRVTVWFPEVYSIAI